MMRKLLPTVKWAILFFLLFSFFQVPSSSAQIFRWTDEHGAVRFSDSPPPGVKAEKVQGVSGKFPGGTANIGSSENPKIKVVMYMTDWCVYCRKARELLRTLDVDLVEHNVEKSREKYQEFKAKGGRGVPLIDVEGILIRGYNEDSIKTAVEEKKRR